MNIFIPLLKNIRSLALLVFFFVNHLSLATAKNYNIDWLNGFGMMGNESIWGLTLSNDGFLYIVGSSSSDSIDFDPGPGTSFMGHGEFIAKYDTAGHFVWMKKLPNNIACMDIVVDSKANIYITGDFSDTADFDPGLNTVNLISNGGTDVFVLKLNKDGAFIWAKSIGSKFDDYGVALATDASGNIITTGWNQGNFVSSVSIDFDPGSNVDNINAVGTSSPFILKLDSNGNYMWAKKTGPIPPPPLARSTGGPFDIAVDPSGNILYTGYFYGTIDFDPGTGTHLLSATIAQQSGFVSKLDSVGNFIWAKTFTGTANVYPQSISLDASGSVYLSGSFFAGASPTVSFDANPSTAIADTAMLTSFGVADKDVFIIKLYADGNFGWAKQIGGDGYDEATGNYCDANGTIYTVGTYFCSSNNGNGASAAVDFDPGKGIFNLGGQLGSSYFFLSVLDSAGSFVAARNFGSNPATLNTQLSYPLKVKIDQNDDIYIAGFYDFLNSPHQASTTDFDPGPDVFNINYGGYVDMFFLKLGTCRFVDTVSAMACDNYTFRGQTYREGGIYTTPIANAPGRCDSIITLDLTLNHSSRDTLFVTNCDSFVFNNQTYTLSGNYIHKFTTAGGCDSVVTLSLQVGHTPDNSVSQFGNTLTSLASGFVYQWIDCGNNGKSISGATDQSFTAQQAGQYAVVIIGTEGCSDTSACYNVAGAIGIREEIKDHKIEIYPNPATSVPMSFR